MNISSHFARFREIRNRAAVPRNIAHRPARDQVVRDGLPDHAEPEACHDPGHAEHALTGAQSPALLRWTAIGRPDGATMPR
jgi:hypothetical protein